MGIGVQVVIMNMGIARVPAFVWQETPPLKVYLKVQEGTEVNLEGFFPGDVFSTALDNDSA
jgi:hypothetical protein